MNTTRLHDALIRDCQYMNNYEICEFDINVPVSDRGAIIAIIIYFIAHEPTVDILKLAAYFLVLNKKVREKEGEYLFNCFLSDKNNSRFRKFKNFINFMVDKDFMRFTNDKQHLGLTVKCVDIIKRFPKILKSINPLLEWLLLNGRYISSGETQHIKDLQKILDNYFDVQFRNPRKKGELYERFIGYLFEKEKYQVEYIGINKSKGGGDGGIDLICRNSKMTWLVQCKNWSKKISSGKVRDFIGAVVNYRLAYPEENVKGAFFSTSFFSNKAWEEAKNIYKIDIALYGNNVLPKQFPLIKCCKSDNTYYLPTDKDYKLIKINYSAGDFYCLKVLEAEKRGFKHKVSSQLLINYSNSQKKSKKNDARKLNRGDDIRAVRNIYKVMDSHTLEFEQKEK